MHIRKPIHKFIDVPAGKTLKSTIGRYVWEGPTQVIVDQFMSLEPTFTDGTKWEYVGESNAKDVAASPKKRATQRAKNPTTEEPSTGRSEEEIGGLASFSGQDTGESSSVEENRPE